MEAARDDSRAVPEAALAVTHAVAAAVVPDGSRVVAKALADTHVPAEAPGEILAVAAPRVGLAEVVGCVECPDGVVGQVAAGPLADALAAQVWSAEFLADEKAVAVSSAEVPDDYYRAALVAVLADDCSPAAYPGIDEAAGRGLGRADLQTADVEPADRDDRCPREHYARRDDRCRQEHCESPEGPVDCQERRVEEHCRWNGRDCSGRHYLDRHCSDHRGAARSGFRERRAVGCSAVPDDYRLAVRDVVLRHDYLGRSVDPDDCRSAVRGDCQDRLAVPEQALLPDYPGRSAVHLDDWLVRFVVLDGCRGRSDSGLRGLRVAKVEPEPAVRRERFLPEAASDDRLHQDRRLAD